MLFIDTRILTYKAMPFLFGWLADQTSINFIFQVSTWLPLLGVVALFLPDIRPQKIKE